MVDDIGRVYLAGRDIDTPDGPRMPGDTVDVTEWSARQLEISLSVGQLYIAPAPGRTRYVAAQRLRVADGWLEPGDPVPDTQFACGRLGPHPYLALGHIVPNPLAAVPV